MTQASALFNWQNTARSHHESETHMLYILLADLVHNWTGAPV